MANIAGSVILRGKWVKGEKLIQTCFLIRFDHLISATRQVSDVWVKVIFTGHCLGGGQGVGFMHGI